MYGDRRGGRRASSEINARPPPDFFAMRKGLIIIVIDRIPSIAMEVEDHRSQAAIPEKRIVQPFERAPFDSPGGFGPPFLRSGRAGTLRSKAAKRGNLRVKAS